MAPTTAAAMGSVPVDKAGVGSAVINSMRQVGGSLGIAIMGALVATASASPAFSPRMRSQFVEGYHRALARRRRDRARGCGDLPSLTVRKLPRHAEGAADSSGGAREVGA